ncbi:dipeptide/tripeptide permease [Mycobacterium sp. MAA66]|uniref:ATP synthase subunit I n=1 Tax=Mycobacterium sp. MAA66 TaxID=3156297 RepID=UPI0035157B42
MTTPAQDAPFVLPGVTFAPARLFAVSVVVTGLALAGGYTVSGNLKFGAFFGLGMALGLGNALLVRRAVAKVTAKDHPLKMQMAANSAMRLVVISAIALLITWYFRKDGGIGVLFGVALFQAILVMSTALPVMKKLRAGQRDVGTGGDQPEVHDGSVVKD